MFNGDEFVNRRQVPFPTDFHESGFFFALKACIIRTSVGFSPKREKTRYIQRYADGETCTWEIAYGTN
jgi:hypothetical protein